MSLTKQDLEVINIELTTKVQEMDEAIRLGKSMHPTAITYLEEMRGAVAKVRKAMNASSRPDLRVVA